jgi:hypothetical protein
VWQHDNIWLNKIRRTKAVSSAGVNWDSFSKDWSSKTTIPLFDGIWNKENYQMKKRKQISSDEAKRIGDSLYIDWDQIDLEQFRQGLMGIHKMDPETRPFDEVLLPAKIVLAHVEEFPDYFARLEKLKAEIDEYQARAS